MWSIGILKSTTKRERRHLFVLHLQTAMTVFSLSENLHLIVTKVVLGQAPDHVLHLPPLLLHLVLVHLHLLQRWLRTTPPPPPPPSPSSTPLPPGPGLLKEPLTTGGEFEL